MMNRLRLIMAVGLFLAAPAGFPRAQQSWQTFNCPDGKCSVLLPAGTVVPTITNKYHLINGQTGESKLFAVGLANDEIAYGLLYIDFPASYAALSPSFVLAQFFTTETKNTIILYHRMIALNGVPGQAYACRTSAGTLWQVRQYYLYPRTYELILVISDGYRVPASDVVTFLHSLEIH